MRSGGIDSRLCTSVLVLHRRLDLAASSQTGDVGSLTGSIGCNGLSCCCAWASLDWRTMGRPSLAESRRAQILDAYEECVLQFGMEARSLEALADQAGIKRSVVRHYMDNRAELRRAFVERIISRATRAYRWRICGNSSTKSSAVRMSTPRPNARPAETGNTDSPSPCSAEPPRSSARAR
jgi:hypothetical protein